MIRSLSGFRIAISRLLRLPSTEYGALLLEQTGARENGRQGVVALVTRALVYLILPVVGERQGDLHGPGSRVRDRIFECHLILEEIGGDACEAFDEMQFLRGPLE